MTSTVDIDFTTFTKAIDRFSSTIIITPCVKVLSNTDGDESFTESATVTTTAYITRKNYPWKFDAAGLIQGGDAILISNSQSAINKDYKITWNGNTYRVQDVLDREQIGGIFAYRRCNLFLITK